MEQILCFTVRISSYRNISFIVDVAVGQIPRSTERISSYLNFQFCIYTVFQKSDAKIQIGL